VPNDPLYPEAFRLGRCHSARAAMRRIHSTAILIQSTGVWATCEGMTDANWPHEMRIAVHGSRFPLPRHRARISVSSCKLPTAPVKPLCPGTPAWRKTRQMRRPLPHLLRAVNGVLFGGLRLVALDGELRGRTHESRGKRARHGDKRLRCACSVPRKTGGSGWARWGWTLPNLRAWCAAHACPR
jgi:hypothetical protein